jgi:hypothetical protein
MEPTLPVYNIDADKREEHEVKLKKEDKKEIKEEFRI